MKTKNYWLIVERYDNWLTDQMNGFASFGIPTRKIKMASEIKKGDLIVNYVSKGKSAFAGIRIATQDGPIKAKAFAEYDEPFEYYIETTPFISLEEDNWVPIKLMLDDLNLTRGKKNWANVMLVALKRLDQEDGELIENRLKLRLRDEEGAH